MADPRILYVVAAIVVALLAIWVLYVLRTAKAPFAVDRSAEPIPGNPSVVPPPVVDPLTAPAEDFLVESNAPDVGPNAEPSATVVPPPEEPKVDEPKVDEPKVDEPKKSDPPTS